VNAQFIKNTKAKFYQNEELVLSKYAFKSIKYFNPSSELDDDIRLCFQKDKDKIIYSKAFRRLKGKTQVFLFPIGDHYRTRLTHTLEVAQISRSVSRALFLNEDLSEAIALGHDLGHTPFGHLGEKVLASIISFSHYLQSKKIAENLNLSHEVVEGIFKHSKGKGPILDDNLNRYASTLEAQLVRVADIIAYLNHDLDDAYRAGLINLIPENITKVLGKTSKERYASMINDLIYSTNEAISSDFKNKIKRVYLSAGILTAMDNLRDFLYNEVYENKLILKDYDKIYRIIDSLFNYYYKNPDEISELIKNDEQSIEIKICDYISGMTDSYAINTYKNLFLPKQW